MAQPDDGGFVKRGFFLLGLMTLLVGAVLSIIFYRPGQVVPITPDDLPAQASSKGWQIRYNAAATLARRGSGKMPWGVIHEMLDEKQQMKNFPLVLPDGRETTDEAGARAIVVTGLKAVAEWCRKQKEAGVVEIGDPAFARVRTQIDQLAQSPIAELKSQAEKTKAIYTP